MRIRIRNTYYETPHAIAWIFFNSFLIFCLTEQDLGHVQSKDKRLPHFCKAVFPIQIRKDPQLFQGSVSESGQMVRIQIKKESIKLHISYLKAVLETLHDEFVNLLRKLCCRIIQTFSVENYIFLTVFCFVEVCSNMIFIDLDH